MFSHRDTLEPLNRKSSLRQKVRFLHRVLRKKHPKIDRIAVATYDPDSDLLKTLTYSSDRKSPLTGYQARLSECGSLMEILDKGNPRVVNDMDLFSGSTKQHTRALSEYGSSYTTPIVHEDSFYGFIFFNSLQKNAFPENLLIDLDLIAHLITLLVVEERASVHTLVATIRSAQRLAHYRDPETGRHLERMARYARLIARELAKEYKLDDQFIEHVFLFAPLHDLGKIGIPDDILLKRGKLTPTEFEVMKKHARLGREMVDQLLSSHALEGVEDVKRLRNIAEYHHEAIDGSGYPAGLKDGEIPLESRIVAVADVFDAVTSGRPYKPAWSNDDAFALLRELSGSRLDRGCVDVFIRCRKEVEAIQASFRESRCG